MTIDIDREVDGRYIADVPSLPGLMAYGATECEAVDRVLALVLEHGREREEHIMLLRAWST